MQQTFFCVRIGHGMIILLMQKYIKILGFLHRQNKKVKAAATYLSLDTVLLAHFCNLRAIT